MGKRISDKQKHNFIKNVARDIDSLGLDKACKKHGHSHFAFYKWQRLLGSEPAKVVTHQVDKQKRFYRRKKPATGSDQRVVAFIGSPESVVNSLRQYSNQ